MNKVDQAMQVLGIKELLTDLITSAGPDIEKARNLLDGFKSTILKSMYRKLVLQHHPDKGGDPEKFREIQQAYELINGMKIHPRPIVKFTYKPVMYRYYNNSWTSTTSGSATIWDPTS